MKKILAFSDIHMRGPAETIIGLDPFSQFEQAMAHATDSHPDASHMVLMGDLANSGKTAEYQRLKQVLDRAPLPWSLIPGNHDNRTNLASVFPDLPTTAQGHLQSIVDIGDDRLVMLDTLDGPPFRNDYHAGLLCDDRMAWLEQTLANSNNRRLSVFTHHPAFPTGIEEMDAIPLLNGADLLTRLADYSGPTHLFSGHVHRTISGSIQGQPFSMFKSTCHQTPLVLKGGDVSMSVAEPAAYGLILLLENTIVAHSEEFQLAQHDTTPKRDALPE